MTAAADVWSYGVTVLEAVAQFDRGAWEQTTFFSGMYPSDVEEAIAVTTDEDLKQQIAGVRRATHPDLALWNVVAKCVRVDPKSRPSMRSVLAEHGIF